MHDSAREEEAAGWLDCLISSYERVRRHDPDAAEDPAATDEMLNECRWLAARLRMAVPDREPELAVATTDDIPW